MCGILFTDNPDLPLKSFRKSLDLMTHRGPDSKLNVQVYKNFKLGHNRLKILDLDDRSNQPFSSYDGRYLMIFNGEVYNFKELSKDYELKPRTTSDTEVVLEMYAKLGPEMLNHLNGMFSIIILDTKTEEVFIARDRLGIKPLYFSMCGGHYIFASEIASIVELMDTVDIDMVGVRQYRKLRTFFNGHTIYSNIKMFPAGHYMLSGKLRRYWKLPDAEQLLPTNEEIRELINSSVAYRCISDVPVGSYLSGGLDSTIVAGLASKPHTWTVGFRDNNEFEWGRLAAEEFHAEHTEVLIDEKEFVEIAKEMIKKRREPLSVPNEVLLYKMTKEVKARNTVVLSGEGADELFFGYDRIFKWADNNKWDIKQFSKLYSYGSNDDIEIVEYVLEPYLHHKKAVDIVASFFQISHLHGLLRRLDNSTMLCSVEARVPFVDHRLVERMAMAPLSFRMKDGVVKAPLKEAFRDLVPKDIIERVKVGFPVPLDSIPLSTNPNKRGMDRWLEFNLAILGVETPEQADACLW